MSQSTWKRSPHRRVRVAGAILGLSLLVLATPAAEASPIRNHQIGARGARDLRAWSSFLAGGSALWSRIHAPHISGAVHVAMAQGLGSSDPRTNPWVQYLLWRHDLNPARFDRWHPQLGPALEKLPPLTTCPCCCTPKPTPSPQTTRNINKPPRTPNPSPGILIPPEANGPKVPEPDALTISLALIGTGVWWRWRGGMRPARVPD